MIYPHAKKKKIAIEIKNLWTVCNFYNPSQLVILSCRRHLGPLVSTENITRNVFYVSHRYFQTYYTFSSDVQIPRYAMAAKSNMATGRHHGWRDLAFCFEYIETWLLNLSSCYKKGKKVSIDMNNLWTVFKFL